MLVIGITGPTGAGKTTTLQELENMGGAVIDCDALYHELLKSDKTLQGMLIKKFGPITDPSGAIDRKKLGNIVFQDPQALNTLNTVVHEVITEAVSHRLDLYRSARRHPAAAIDAIGLFESGLDHLCDTTLAVTAPAEIRVRRIMVRDNISEEYARSRVAAQNPDSFYLSRCEYALVNDCASKEEFGARSRTLLKNIIL